MYIRPLTNIKLLHNCPLDPTYDHTISFRSESEQASYFSSLTKFNLTNYTYQRVRKGVARVGIECDKLYDCNYMMFQNASYGNKWFYAFISNVEYVNNECSEITFELDVMQSWYFDYDLDYCFVEREHTITDVIGEHIEPEGVDVGEYVFNDYDSIEYMVDMCVIISVVDTNDETSSGTLYDGIYGGCKLWCYDSTDVQSINGKITEYIKAPDSIISIYMCPKILIGEIPENHLLVYGASAVKTTVTTKGITGEELLNGYKPKNKKLYTYPFNFYHVDNASGSELTLRYEFFKELKPIVEISGTITCPVTATLRPCGYKGSGDYDEIGGYKTLNTENLQLNNYPMCSWNVDAYKAWLAQNSIPISLSTFSSVGKSALSLLPIDTAVSAGISKIHSALSEGYSASIQADICKGSFNNGGGNVSNYKQQFYGGRCSITAEYARVIDEYFNVFGYGVKRIKKPNIDSRPHWNYVKTIGCTITGSVPGDDVRKICDIYNAGITFWRKGSEIGKYYLDNTP